MTFPNGPRAPQPRFIRTMNVGADHQHHDEKPATAVACVNGHWQDKDHKDIEDAQHQKYVCTVEVAKPH